MKLGRVASNTIATNSTSMLDCHAKCSNIKIILYDTQPDFLNNHFRRGGGGGVGGTKAGILKKENL
jgi:hypothetical protein